MHIIITITCSGRDLYGQTVGIAFTGSMCNEHTSVGLTQDNGRNLQSVVTTAAHEIGHLFSMTHDGKSVRVFYHYQLRSLF